MLSECRRGAAAFARALLGLESLCGSVGLPRSVCRTLYGACVCIAARGRCSRRYLGRMRFTEWRQRVDFLRALELLVARPGWMGQDGDRAGSGP